MDIDLNLDHMPRLPEKKDWRVGCVGAGFIMRDIHLVAYGRAGYNAVAITSADPEQTRATAEQHGIPKVYESYQELVADESIEVLDIAVPPHVQLDVIRAAVRQRGHIKGILAHKPLAVNYRDARKIVALCEDAGIVLGVNQNMRYDQSIRSLKTLLDRGYLGDPILGTIEMRAGPHWAEWCSLYGRLTLLIMSIHHLDTFRFLFGEPESVYASARPDPRFDFAHQDGIVLYILEYANGFRATAWDDVWAGAHPAAARDTYIKWRVEGAEGMAEGSIGWPSYPNAVPSTLRFTTARQPGAWLAPEWKETWFPDAFQGTMGMLLDALNTGNPPAISGRDNLKTMALVEASYRSLAEHRPVSIREIIEED